MSQTKIRRQPLAATPKDGAEPDLLTERKHAKAARTIQQQLRAFVHDRNCPPSIAAAREMADDRMPRAADGRLYRVKPLTEPLRPWRDGARLSPPWRPWSDGIRMGVYDAMGVSIGLYMRLVHGHRKLFAALTLVGLTPLIYNLCGSQSTVDSSKLYVIHTLGNADDVSLAHGIPDLIAVLLLGAALVFGTARMRKAELEINDATRRLSAANYTLMVHGLPRDPAITNASMMGALRASFADHGTVLAVCVARADRDFLMLVKCRAEVVDGLEHHRSAARRGELDAKGKAAMVKLEQKLRALNQKVREQQRSDHEAAAVTTRSRCCALVTSLQLQPRHSVQMLQR